MTSEHDVRVTKKPIMNVPTTCFSPYVSTLCECLKRAYDPPPTARYCADYSHTPGIYTQTTLVATKDEHGSVPIPPIVLFPRYMWCDTSPLATDYWEDLVEVATSNDLWSTLPIKADNLSENDQFRKKQLIELLRRNLKEQYILVDKLPEEYYQAMVKTSREGPNTEFFEFTEIGLIKLWRLHLLNMVDKVRQVFALAAQILMPTPVSDILRRINPQSDYVQVKAAILNTPHYKQTAQAPMLAQEAEKANLCNGDKALEWLKRVIPSFSRTTRTRPIRFVKDGHLATIRILELTYQQAVEALTEGLIECCMKHPYQHLHTQNAYEALRLPATTWATEKRMGISVPLHPFVARMHQDFWRDRLEQVVQSMRIPLPKKEDWQEVLTPDREAVHSRMMLSRDWDPMYYFDMRSLSTPKSACELRFETGTDTLTMMQHYEAQRYLYPTKLRDPEESFPTEGTKFENRYESKHPVPTLPSWANYTTSQECFMFGDKPHPIRAACSLAHADRSMRLELYDISLYLACRLLQSTSRLERAQVAARALSKKFNVGDPNLIVVYLHRQIASGHLLWHGLTKEQIAWNEMSPAPRPTNVKIDDVFGLALESAYMDIGPVNQEAVQGYLPESDIFIQPVIQSRPVPKPLKVTASEDSMAVDAEDDAVATRGSRVDNNAEFEVPIPLTKEKAKKKDRERKDSVAESVESAGKKKEKAPKTKSKPRKKPVPVPPFPSPKDAQPKTPAGSTEQAASSSDEASTTNAPAPTTAVTAMPEAAQSSDPPPTATPTPATPTVAKPPPSPKAVTPTAGVAPSTPSSDSTSEGVVVVVGTGPKAPAPTPKTKSPTAGSRTTASGATGVAPKGNGSQIRTRSRTPSVPSGTIAIADKESEHPTSPQVAVASPTKKARTDTKERVVDPIALPASRTSVDGNTHVAVFTTNSQFDVNAAKILPTSSMQSYIPTPQQSIANAATTNASPLSPPLSAAVPEAEPPSFAMTPAVNSEAESDAHMGEGDHMDGYESCGDSGQASGSNLGASAGEESGTSKMEEEG
eukprot:GHVU01002828.1.p1 GENE.GHVU01002828.1~~GHVU01002828.1.p1  ORF type:complete len:1123 (-),score=113.36 GHVU01002828.1:825-3938(-)